MIFIYTRNVLYPLILSCLFLNAHMAFGQSTMTGSSYTLNGGFTVIDGYLSGDTYSVGVSGDYLQVSGTGSTYSLNPVPVISAPISPAGDTLQSFTPSGYTQIYSSTNTPMLYIRKDKAGNDTILISKNRDGVPNNSIAITSAEGQEAEGWIDAKGNTYRDDSYDFDNGSSSVFIEIQTKLATSTAIDIKKDFTYITCIVIFLLLSIIFFVILKRRYKNSR